MKVLLIVAMESELDGFLKKLEYNVELISGNKVYICKINNVDLYIAKTGVGKVNAASLTTALILKIKPKYVLNAGIAGGMTPSIKILDVVASTKVAYHDFDITAFGYKMGQLDDNLYDFKASRKLLSLLDDSVKKGLIVSGDKFVAGIENSNIIKSYFPKALACEMEGCAIAHVAWLFKRKFLIIRCISDNVYDEQLQTKKYIDNKPLAIDKVCDVTIDLLSKL